MKQNNFDEYQLMKRYRVSFQTLILLLIMVFINGMVSDHYMWATPIVQAMIIVSVSTAYFVSVCLFKDAYIGNHTRNKAAGLVLFFVLGAANTATSLYANWHTGYVENGALQNDVVSLILGILFLYLSLAGLLSLYVLKKRSRD